MLARTLTCSSSPPLLPAPCLPSSLPSVSPPRRAGAVPGEPCGPAARHGLLQRLLRPPRPQADCTGWVDGGRCGQAGSACGGWLESGSKLMGGRAAGAAAGPTRRRDGPSLQRGARKAQHRACAACFSVRLVCRRHCMQGSFPPLPLCHRLQASRWCKTGSSPSAAPTTELEVESISYQRCHGAGKRGKPNQRNDWGEGGRPS